VHTVLLPVPIPVGHSADMGSHYTTAESTNRNQRVRTETAAINTIEIIATKLSRTEGNGGVV
jgi:hypothetical protein